MSLNKVQLIGRVGKAPEVREFGGGKSVCSFSMVTSEKWKDKVTGEKKERSEWHNIVIFGQGLVAVVQKYVIKGSKLYVCGKLQTEKWQGKDGKDNYTTKIFVDDLIMLDGKEKEAAPQATAYDTSVAVYEPAPHDDEIPF